MLLKRVSLHLAYLLAGLSVVGVAAALQEEELLRIGLMGFIAAAWLVSGLLFGFSVRNSLLFCALLFVKPLPTTFMLALPVLMLTLVLEYLQSGRAAFTIPHPLALIVLAGTGVFGFARATDPAFALPYFLSTAVVPVLAFILVSNSRIARADFLVWMRAISLIGAFLALIGVPMALLNPMERYGSLWITAMTINGFYTLSFFFSLALGVREEQPKRRLFWFACAALIFLGMLYTYTRMAMLAVFFGFFLLMLRMKRLRYIGMIALALLPLIIPSSMVQRIQMGFTFDYSLLIRLVAWYYSLQQIALHPLFGQGISVWKDWYAGAAPLDILYAEHSHNLFLKIWLELGLFGFIAYFAIIGSVVRSFYLKLVKRTADNFDRIVWIGVLSLLFACLTDIFIQQYEISLVFWITLALMHKLTRVQPQTEAT